MFLTTLEQKIEQKRKLKLRRQKARDKLLYSNPEEVIQHFCGNNCKGLPAIHSCVINHG